MMLVIKTKQVGQLSRFHLNPAQHGSHSNSVCLGHWDRPAEQGLGSSSKSGMEEIWRHGQHQPERRSREALPSPVM